MTLPSTGPISLSQVNTELGRSASTSISLNESAVRHLALMYSGPISMSDLRGKGLYIIITPSSLSESGVGATRVLGAANASVMGALAANVTYSWTISSPSGGTWSAGSGSTLAATNPEVTDVLPGVTATATLNCTATVGNNTYTASIPLSFFRTDLEE